MKELRCVCPRAPILAMWGIDEDTGEPVIHVRSWRNSKIHVDVVVKSGVVQIRCRECSRLNQIRMRKGRPRLTQVEIEEEFLDAPHPART